VFKSCFAIFLEPQFKQLEPVYFGCMYFGFSSVEESLDGIKNPLSCCDDSILYQPIWRYRFNWKKG